MWVPSGVLLFKIYIISAHCQPHRVFYNHYNNRWQNLQALAAARNADLDDAIQIHQFFANAKDIEVNNHRVVATQNSADLLGILSICHVLSFYLYLVFLQCSIILYTPIFNKHIINSSQNVRDLWHWLFHPLFFKMVLVPILAHNMLVWTSMVTRKQFLKINFWNWWKIWG